ncbi:DUF6054 family protein [Bacillus sp. AFS041924]|uniref:DUF6054 family protein n=1 Tax=Bacillus sp. AFS041924 TaxID=2033503 RepID=UPI000BFB67EA|nr:DUF6054 family protein [Bacillus sp. AFS041924]PGS54217.1 hypothetical protein COC46_05775 [Bacillus sp. AFS041924]
MKHYLELTVNIKPMQGCQRILEDEDLKSNLIFQDYKAAGEKEIVILVFQKFFFRNNSTATLTVTIDNFNDVTYVKCISSGNGEGLFDFGWGAGKSFIRPIREMLAANIMEIIEDN